VATVALEPAAGRAGARTRLLRAVLRPQTVVLGAVVAVVAYLALVPLGFLLWNTFVDDGRLTLDAVTEAYSRAGLRPMVVSSLVFAGGSTLLAVPLGTVLAYLVVRTDLPGKGLMFAASLVPLVIPGILHTIAWIFLLSPNIGIYNDALAVLPGAPRFDVFSMGGMILVEGVHLSPLVFLLMVAAFRSMDPALEESAVMSGARLPTVVRRVTLPLVRPALYGAVLIMAIRALEAFEVPALLGIPGGIWVFTSQIWRSLRGFPPDYASAGAFAVSLLVITSAGVFAHGRLSRRGRAWQTVTGRGFRPRPIPLGRWRWPAFGLLTVWFLLVVAAPVLVLLYVSTQRYYSSPSWSTLGDASLDNYRYVFDHPQAMRALRNSFLLGVGSATGVVFFTAMAAWLVVRTKARGRWVVDNLATLPLVVPGLVMGVALLFVYLRSPVPVFGTLWILFIAYCTRYLPYGMRYSTGSMYQVAGELEESAQVCGATWWQTFRRIDLPLVMPGLVAGWIYIVLVSVRELSSSILLYSPGNEVLSVLIWEQWENGQFTELAALGVVMVAGLLVLVMVARRLGASVGLREA
jgi:iron(III) transport system permease protein